MGERLLRTPAEAAEMLAIRKSRLLGMVRGGGIGYVRFIPSGPCGSRPRNSTASPTAGRLIRWCGRFQLARTDAHPRRRPHEPQVDLDAARPAPRNLSAGTRAEWMTGAARRRFVVGGWAAARTAAQDAATVRQKGTR